MGTIKTKSGSKSKPIHYGRELKKAIKSKGLKKFKVAELLDITRPTLDTRLKDGKFTEAQIETIKTLLS